MIRSALLAALVSMASLIAGAVPARAQETRVVRLSDAVGDTIDRAERDSFGLFPRTPSFRWACVLLTSGQLHCAAVGFGESTAFRTVFLRLAPSQVRRIRYLIDNHASGQELVGNGQNYALVVARFWESVETNPLSAVDGSPVHVVFSVPAEATRPESRPGPPKSWIIAGALIGCCLGGTAGVLLSSKVNGGSPCSGGCFSMDPPWFGDYTFDNATCCAATGAGVAVGAGGGCLLGRLAQSRRQRSRTAASARAETSTAVVDTTSSQVGQHEHGEPPADSITSSPDSNGRRGTE